jgi:hypothetical protein
VFLPGKLLKEALKGQNTSTKKAKPQHHRPIKSLLLRRKVKLSLFQLKDSWSKTACRTEVGTQAYFFRRFSSGRENFHDRTIRQFRRYASVSDPFVDGQTKQALETFTASSRKRHFPENRQNLNDLLET